MRESASLRSKSVASTAGTLALAILAPASPAATQSPAANVRCDIVAEERSGAIIIKGRISAAIAVSGNYRLQAQAKGRTTSNVAQSANFQVAPGLPTDVGVVSLSGAERIEVTLALAWQDGDASCSRVIERS